MKIHFIGIGGIGVSSLAQYYLAIGHDVSGSDLAESEITDFLTKKGAKVYIGQNAGNLSFDVEFVVHTPAVPKDNPEYLESKKRGIRIQSYPEALGDLTKEKFTIAVSGTHGKSTTTSMLALILVKAKLDPTVILGTKLKEFRNNNFRIGRSKYLVIEADEHMASFLNYWPNVIVLTNIDRDHLDYYRNLRNILKTFKEYVNHLANTGTLVINADDGNIKKILSENQKFKKAGYSLKQKEAVKIKKIMRIPGSHIVYDALAALTTARVLKIADSVSFKALSEFKGSWRRFEIIKAKLQGKKITIVSDYAHNPAKAEAAINSCREKWQNKKIIIIYQPHQYQRTYFLFNEFVKVFRRASSDKIIITDIYDVAGREEKNIKENVNSQKLVKTVNKKSVIYLPKEKIMDYLKKEIKGGEIVVIMGAGDIYNMIKLFDLKD
ncbi:MAG: UDP-N-acetylmuramate--L-alanine ligase [Candidatus Parcubacteria bacterium]|nr:UDP-N-acetylmuramate--L-alanine ligase [Candidatus Parcubacteria bacterium]